MISAIQNIVQDRKTEAWKRLCEYVDQLAKREAEEFSPREVLGDELFSQIHTLPESIAKLKSVKKVLLYGSKLKRIPPEIGEMESLEYFDPYTSYNLHWFPYELTNCKKLKDSRISTRALYGNFKNRMSFPKLDNNPVRYFSEKLNCSVCQKEMSYSETSQFWISLLIGTDIVPLLVNLCSTDCKVKLPIPPENYVSYPHKGGYNQKQPPDQTELWENERRMLASSIKLKDEKISQSNLKLLKLTRKLWGK